jgi:DUF1680 family protein
MRWSRTRQPNIKSSFCCPPNVVRTIAEAQNYIYSLSRDTLWVHLYGGSSLKTSFAEGGTIAVRQETEYPWSGSIRLAVDVAPEREISIKLRIPGWTKPGDVKVLVNGSRSEAKPLPGTYLELRRFWKAGDVVSLEIKMEPRLWEANTLVEETLNQVAVKRGPIVYCLESNDLPKGVRLDDVALALDPEKTVFLDGRERIVNTDLVSLSVAALEIRRPEAQGVKPLFHEVSQVKPRQIRIKLVPYYAWGNRGDADMSVWLSAR